MLYSLLMNATLNILDILKDESIRLHISELSAREVPGQSCGKESIEGFGAYPQKRRTAYSSKEVEAWLFQVERRESTL